MIILIVQTISQTITCLWSSLIIILASCIWYIIFLFTRIHLILIRIYPSKNVPSILYLLTSMVIACYRRRRLAATIIWIVYTLKLWLWDLVFFVSFFIWFNRTCARSPIYLSCLVLISVIFIIGITWVSIHRPQIHIICIYSQTIILCVIPVLIIIIHI